MLLKLIPALSEPTIHFSLSFADLPYNLPTPPAWTAQLAQLMHEDLETPTTLHSLDRSAGVTSLLEEVELDVALGEVRCRFIDGKVERWGFWEGITSTGAFKEIDGNHYGKKLSAALEKIVKDVNESTIEDERVMRERAWEKQKVERTRSPSSVTAASVAKSSSGSSKPSRHKKSRSFFMQIVSAVGSIINLSTPSSPSSNSTSFFSSRPSSSSQPWSTPTSPPPTSGPTGTSQRARALRRAARSSLVDTYRLFVLTELVRRFAGPAISIDTLEAHSAEEEPLQEYRRQDPTSFCVWILHSMRRRMLERMDQILEEAEEELGSELSVLDAASNPDLSHDSGLETTTMIVPVSFSDDEEEPTRPPLSTTHDDSDSDDGSSVHTPSTTSHFQCYPGTTSTRTSSRSSNTSSNSSHSDEHDLRATSPSPPVPPKDLPQAQPCVPSSTVQRRPTIRLLVSQPVQPVPPVQRLSAPALEEYRYLMDSRKRLAQLLLFAASQSRVANEEVCSRLDILAVRSRRRAWSNRALSMVAKSRTGLGGSAAYGLATPFRSSALARYMWTAEDLANRSSSADSSPASSLSRCSRAAFPSYRPRLRPKIRHDVEAVLGIEVHGESLVDDEESHFEEDLADVHPCEVDLYAGIKGAMHEKRVTTRKVSMSSRAPAPSEKSRSVIGRLFPVNEEREVEVQDHYPNDDQVFEFSLHGRTTYKKDCGHTFMGCDEVRVESDEEEEEDMYAYNGEDDEEHQEFDIELGFGEFGNREVPRDVDMTEAEIVERPKVSPKVRSTSMMGAFLQRAKGMQNSFQSNHRQSSELRLTKDSLLCQSVPESVVVPSSLAPSKPAPQLQTQSQVRFKRTNPPSPSHVNEKAIKIARTSPAAIYTNIEVDMLDIQVYDPDSTDYAQYKNEVSKDGDNVRPGILPKHRSQKSATGQEEFTLSMDVQKRTNRRRVEGSRQLEYPTRPLGRHEFDEPRRPKLDTLFHPPTRTEVSANPMVPC